MKGIAIIAIALMGARPMTHDRLPTDQIRADHQAAGEAVQPPATPEQTAALVHEAQDRFAATVPQDYVDFLHKTNGVDFDGLVLYGAGQTPEARGPGGFWQGLVAANAEWRRSGAHEGYLILGDTDMDLVTVDLAGERASLRDRVSGDVVETFDSVAAMLDSLMRRRFG